MPYFLFEIILHYLILFECVKKKKSYQIAILVSMKYAIVDDKRVEPFPGGKGLCICCGSETIAKCGDIINWHWSHISKLDCDAWWETETPWHRDWKNHFPEDCQEIIHHDEKTGEKHIADVKLRNRNTLVIEFQNSPISIEELKSRELFYDNMIWIINAKEFRKNFHILGELPNPKDVFFSDIKFHPRKKENEGRCYSKISEIEASEQRYEVFSNHRIRDKILESYVGHHLYDWKYQSKVWFKSSKRCYLDFGNEFLYELGTHGKGKTPCVKKIEKQYFIEKALASLC